MGIKLWPSDFVKFVQNIKNVAKHLGSAKDVKFYHVYQYSKGSIRLKIINFLLILSQTLITYNKDLFRNWN